MYSLGEEGKEEFDNLYSSILDENGTVLNFSAQPSYQWKVSLYMNDFRLFPLLTGERIFGRA